MLCKSIICMEQMIYIENQPTDYVYMNSDYFLRKNDNFKV